MTDDGTGRRFHWTFNRKVGLAFVWMGLAQWLLAAIFSRPWWMMKYGLDAVFPIAAVLSLCAYFAGFLHLFEGMRYATNAALSLLCTAFLTCVSLAGFVVLAVWISTLR